VQGELKADERDRLAELVEDRQRLLRGRTPRAPEPVRPVVEPLPVVMPPAIPTLAVEFKPAEAPARAEVQPSAPPLELAAPPVEAEVVDASPVAVPQARAAEEMPTFAQSTGVEAIAVPEVSQPPAEPPVRHAAPEPPPRPRRSLGEILAAFMEE